MGTTVEKKAMLPWLIVVAVVIIGLLAFFFVTRPSAENNTEKDVVNQIWGGKAPNAAEEKNIVNDVLNSPWPPVAPIVPAAAPALVVAPPSVRSDFKVEYKETASAKGKIDVKISPTNDPKVMAIRIENKTNQPLLINSITEGRDASGKVIYSSGSDGWYKMDPRYIINDTESPGGKAGIVAKTFWIEVKE